LRGGSVISVFTPPATREAFAASAAFFAARVAEVDGRWDEHGLGEWTVRDLVGHTSRSLLTIESYLRDEVEGHPEAASAAEYFDRAASSLADPVAVTQRGRDAGAALGADPSAAVNDIRRRVTDLVDASPDDALVATPIGSMRLIDYLVARTFELTVHTCDMCAALGLDADVPPIAAAQTAALIGELAARHQEVTALLLSATGRGPLPPGFTVL